VDIDRAKRTATLTVSAPKAAVPTTLEAIRLTGDNWYPLQMARELDDAILNLRTNELDIGTWLLKTTGDARAGFAIGRGVAATPSALAGERNHRLAASHLGPFGRVFTFFVRLDR
jgi:benzoyl-CoA-dihydrodiol lyase